MLGYPKDNYYLMKEIKENKVFYIDNKRLQKKHPLISFDNSSKRVYY